MGEVRPRHARPTAAARSDATGSGPCRAADVRFSATLTSAGERRSAILGSVISQAS
jgi:hypothetical protein